MSVYDRDLDMCACGHVRRAHDLDGDFNGERYVNSWGACTGEHERYNDEGAPVESWACSCETFEEGGDSCGRFDRNDRGA